MKRFWAGDIRAKYGSREVCLHMWMRVSHWQPLHHPGMSSPGHKQQKSPFQRCTKRLHHEFTVAGDVDLRKQIGGGGLCSKITHLDSALFCHACNPGSSLAPTTVKEALALWSLFLSVSTFEKSRCTHLVTEDIL